MEITKTKLTSPDRLKKLLEHYNISPNKLAGAIGLKHNTGVYHILNGRNKKISEAFVFKIIKTYPEINPDWLLTGEGNMLKNGTAAAEKVSFYERQAIPLVSKIAVGGFGSSDFAIAEKDIKEKYVIPKFKHLNVDFMIEVNGSSMYPKYASGDVVACCIIRESSFIQWNKTHVVATREQGIIVKRIQESNNESNLRMVSDNKNYKPFDVPKDEITGIALVVGVVRLE